MQRLLWITLFITCVTSTFLHAARAREHATRLFDTNSNTFPNNLFSYFDIEAAGAYSIYGFNGAKITYPPVVPGPGLVSSSLFAIDPAHKRLVFNQGESGNQYVFANGTYITLNFSTAPNVPLVCSYLPYVNYDQEVRAVNNITLQDIFYQPAPNNYGSDNGGNNGGNYGGNNGGNYGGNNGGNNGGNYGGNYGGGNNGNGFEQVKLYSGIMVDASSCGTMIQFSVAATQGGHIRGIYAAEPFNIPAYGSPTGAAVASSALIFDDSTIVPGVNPSLFQLPPSCFQPNIVNYCAVTGFGAPPTPVCNLFPPIH